MALQGMETRIQKPSEGRDTRKLRTILFDAPSPITLTTIQVLVLSLAFIFMVFMLHTLSRIFPSISPIQMFVAVLVLVLSICISLHLNKK